MTFIEKINSGVEASRTFRNLCDLFDLKKKSVLDIGCGHGHYLRHFGGGSAGITTSKDEVEFGKQNALNIIFGNAEDLGGSISGKHFDVFWANNLFEHLLSPHSFIVKLKQSARDDSFLILGVPVVPKFVSLIRLAKFRGVLASNHINFFTATTLRLTVKRAGFSVESVRPFIFKNAFLDKLVRPIAPHLYVIAKNNTDFKYPPKKLGEWKDDSKYRELLSITDQYE